MQSRISLSLSHHPFQSLALSFLAWKLLLLIIAAASPGPGYDTSASLTAPRGDPAGELPVALRYLIEKLTRWDAIYFVEVANRGHVFEQEWAWWGWPRAIALYTAGKDVILIQLLVSVLKKSDRNRKARNSSL